MSIEIQSNKARGPDMDSELSEEFITFTIAGQLFGISVLQIQDVLNTCHITPIPLAPPEITGSLNLRGQVVTAIDVRRRLGLPARPFDADCMGIVAENEGELYCLMVGATPAASTRRTSPRPTITTGTLGS